MRWQRFAKGVTIGASCVIVLIVASVQTLSLLGSDRTLLVRVNKDVAVVASQQIVASDSSNRVLWREPLPEGEPLSNLACSADGMLIYAVTRGQHLWKCKVGAGIAKGSWQELADTSSPIVFMVVNDQSLWIVVESGSILRMSLNDERTLTEYAKVDPQIMKWGVGYCVDSGWVGLISAQTGMSFAFDVRTGHLHGIESQDAAPISVAPTSDGKLWLISGDGGVWLCDRAERQLVSKKAVSAKVGRRIRCASFGLSLLVVGADKPVVIDQRGRVKCLSEPQFTSANPFFVCGDVVTFLDWRYRLHVFNLLNDK